MTLTKVYRGPRELPAATDAAIRALADAARQNGVYVLHAVVQSGAVQHVTIIEADTLDSYSVEPRGDGWAEYGFVELNDDRSE